MNIMSFLKEKTGPLPNWAWVGVVVVGVGIGFVVMRKYSNANNSSTDTSTATPDTSTAGYPDNQYNGHEVIIVPIGDLYSQYNGQNTGQTTTGQNTDNSTVTRGSRPSTGSTTHPIPPKTYGTVRQRYSSNIPSVMDYDKISPNGVPIRPQPGSSSEVRKQAYGSQIELLGAEVTGPSNVKESGMGSNQWFPVQGGYISSFDLSSVNQQTTSTPSGSTQTTTSTGNSKTTSSQSTSVTGGTTKKVIKS